MSNKENRIKKPQRFILALMLALFPLILANSVMAQTQSEYNDQVSGAKAMVSAAQEALRAAQDAYNQAVAEKISADSAVNSNKTVLDSALAEKSSRQEAVSSAMIALSKAQADYDASLIPDPSWTRPMVEENYTVDVPYTVQVENVRQDTVTSRVARTIRVPHTETITTTTQVPHTTYTTTGGVTAEMYNRRGWNNAPPLPYAGETPLLTTIVPNIDFQWGSGYILQQGNTYYSEDVIVKFTGNLIVPADGNYEFYAPADDGVIFNLAGMGLINDWYDKGGGGTISQSVFIRAGVLYPFTLYYYENGGGAWVQFNVKEISSADQWQVVPEAWLGTQVTETTTYEDVTTTSQVTTYTEEIVYDEVVSTVDVTFYTEETRYRREERTRLIPDGSAYPNLIKDPLLLQPISSAKSGLESAQSDLASATASVASYQSSYDSSIASQSEKASIIELTSIDVNTKQQELNVAQQELEAIPPFREPTPTPSETEEPTPEPTEDVVDKTPNTDETTTPEVQPEPELRVEEAVSEIENLVDINPEQLTEAQVEQLVEAALVVFETAEQGSPQYEQALEALSVAAEADDPKLPEELAAIPGAAIALEVFNNLGNVGADMAPAVREEAEKTVIASVIATGAAVQATVGAAASAAASTSSGGASGGASSGSGSTGRRKE